MPEKAQESTREQGPGSGSNSPGSFAWYDPDTSSWRTFQRSLLGGWVEFSETWMRAGITASGIAFLQWPLAPLTGAIGSSLWPTPHGFSKDGKSNGPSGNELGRAVNQFPTPTVNDAKNCTLPESQRFRDSLIGTVMRYPTPKATDGERGGRGRLLEVIRKSGLVSTPRASRRGAYKDGRKPRKEGGCRSLEEDVAALGESGSLNPAWVEWLMGFPIGWTDLEDSETPSSPKSQSSSDVG